ncbi:sortase A [Microbacterium natoriense]|uniref:Sortase A n=1 Tax=Microbacterium natoriense TaxID=284570 RepID=A0AAW8EYA6_9MICO|nr:class E sortase [Microbacterium natoriense]MDQ0648233.1 sortase A [Microbacterium natoriense]
MSIETADLPGTRSDGASEHDGVVSSSGERTDSSAQSDTTAPPARRKPARSAASKRGGDEQPGLTRRPRRLRGWPGRGAPGGPGRRRRGLAAPEPRRLAPRDGRWWAGAAILIVSLLLLSFVTHAVLLSGAQHHRAQTLAYAELRSALAKAEVPVGQLESEDRLVLAGTPVALIEASAIGLSEVVMEGTTSEVMRTGPGHRRDSVMPGQAGTSVILGRQSTYGGPFAQINRLAPGDDIVITTGQGTHTYRVIGLRRAGDPTPEPVRRGEGRLELQTADGLALFPSGVLYVDAELISPVQETPSRVLAYPALPPEERAMGQNTAVWFVAFFLFVFFVGAAIGVVWLWRNWGRRHAWLIAVPVLLLLGVGVADAAMNALPNLL